MVIIPRRAGHAEINKSGRDGMENPGILAWIKPGWGFWKKGNGVGSSSSKKDLKKIKFCFKPHEIKN